MLSVKHRFINLENIECSGCEQQIEEELSKLEGISEVHYDSQNRRIEIVYDILKIQLKDIENKLNELGYPLHYNFFNRVKDNFLHFTEENEKNNITATPMPCCTYPDDDLKQIKHETK
jgi:copper chaperone CopZ